MPAIGQLSEPVVIQTATTTDDGQGGQTVTWADTRTVFASVQQIGASETLAGRAVQRGNTYRLLVRTDSLWTPPKRVYLRAAAVTCEVIGVRDPDGQGRWLEVDAVEIDV